MESNIVGPESNAGGDRILRPCSSAILLQAGHTILSLELPLYLTHDHCDRECSPTARQLPHRAFNCPSSPDPPPVLQRSAAVAARPDYHPKITKPLLERDKSITGLPGARGSTGAQRDKVDRGTVRRREGVTSQHPPGVWRGQPGTSILRGKEARPPKPSS